MTVTRRSVLLALVQAGGLALAFGRRMALAPGLSPPADPILARLRSLLSEPLGARHIGQINLRQAPAEGEPMPLASLILSSMELTGEDALRLERPALARRFSAGVRADFAAGRTVVLDGWILSRTEARVCALWT